MDRMITRAQRRSLAPINYCIPGQVALTYGPHAVPVSWRYYLQYGTPEEKRAVEVKMRNSRGEDFLKHLCDVTGHIASLPDYEL